MDISEDIKGIIFDLDGTLFDLAVDWSLVIKEVEEITGEPVKSFNSLHEDRSHPGYATIVQKVTKHELEGVRKGHATNAAAVVINKLGAIYKIGVVTRNSHYAAEAVMRALNFDKASVIVGREDVHKLKPNPEALKQALNKLMVSKNNAVLVGDTIQDIQAAHKLGMLCIIVKNDKLTYKPAGADYYINSLLELNNVLQNIIGEE